MASVDVDVTDANCSAVDSCRSPPTRLLPLTATVLGFLRTSGVSLTSLFLGVRTPLSGSRGHREHGRAAALDHVRNVALVRRRDVILCVFVADRHPLTMQHALYRSLDLLRRLSHVRVRHVQLTQPPPHTQRNAPLSNDANTAPSLPDSLYSQQRNRSFMSACHLCTACRQCSLKTAWQSLACSPHGIAVTPSSV